MNQYLGQCFNSYLATKECEKIVYKQTGLPSHSTAQNIFDTFVTRRRWPDWVADYLGDPLAGPVIAAIEVRGGVVPLGRLAEYLPEHSPAQVRQTVDQLINHLALFEDLDLKTFDVLIGFLPAVLKDRQKASQKRGEQPLQPVIPTETGPLEGMYVADLRAVLLETVGQPPRLKQDYSLFQKEEERYLAALDPFPTWMQGGADASAFSRLRLEKTLYLLRHLDLAQSVRGENSSQSLVLTERGQHWLSLSREEQSAWLFAVYRDQKWGDRFGHLDSFFLGSNITSVPMPDEPNQRGSAGHYYGSMPMQDRLPLREAVYRAFADLPVGTFFLVDDFLARYSTGSRNPLLLGRDVKNVVIHLDSRRVPPLEEHLEEAGRRLLWSILQMKLIGMGGVQLGRDASNRLLFARLPRLDVYFGKARVAPSLVEETTRVVVQPDFSIIVIGLNPAPAAELAAFCERVRGRSSQGSMTFRITRDSVVKGLMAGLPAEQVMARLEKHSSTPIPKNVATEVRGWCGWVRTVSPQSMLLLRCLDADTADRVMGAVGKSGERVSDTVVAIAEDALTSALRQKFASHGILLQGGTGRTRGKKKHSR